MPKAKTTKKAKMDVSPTPSQPQTELVGKDWTPGQESNLFVVTRGGFRVSDNEYGTADCPQAIQERDFWQKVANDSNDDTKVEIVEYDNKKHRIW